VLTPNLNKEVLKTNGFEEADVIRSTSSEAIHQKMTSSAVLKIIRSWKTEELPKYCSNED